MNMRHAFLAATAFICLAGTVTALAQEDAAPDSVVVKNGRHHYIYYSDHDIYFAPETKTYYWQEGDAWRSGEDLPQPYRAYITKGGVTIDLDTDRPYERNAWVVEHYKHHEDDHDRDGDRDRDHDHR